MNAGLNVQDITCNRLLEENKKLKEILKDVIVTFQHSCYTTEMSFTLSKVKQFLKEE